MAADDQTFNVSSKPSARVVRVDADGVKTGVDMENAVLPCYRCGARIEVRKLKGGLCTKCFNEKEASYRSELKAYLIKLREYAEATGDQRAVRFREYLIEQEKAWGEFLGSGSRTHLKHDPFSDDRVVDWNPGGARAFRAWEEVQRG